MNDETNPEKQIDSPNAAPKRSRISDANLQLELEPQIDIRKSRGNTEALRRLYCHYTRKSNESAETAKPHSEPLLEDLSETEAKFDALMNLQKAIIQSYEDVKP
jgi:hypothetical protein